MQARQLVQFFVDIAEGMAYVAKLGIVHRVCFLAACLMPPRVRALMPPRVHALVPPRVHAWCLLEIGRAHV